MALALSWAVPFATTAIHAAVVLPFLFLIGVASLLRFGTTILDRLVPALVVVFAAVCVGGLLFSVWPWGLHPVPVAGLGFSVLAVVAAGTGRRPEMPSVGTKADLFIVGLTGLVAAATAQPFLGRDATGRLSLVAIAEDLARHFALFDSIRSSRGYTFLHTSELRVSLPEDLNAYPQGSHFAMGLFDNFVRSTDRLGPAQSGLDHFLVYYVLTLVFLVFAVLWAIHRVAGPQMSVWRYLVLASASAAYLYFGDGIAMFVRGFSSEFVGLGLLAVTVAIVVRPFPRLREQLCLLSALLVSVAFTYYLFLPLAVVMTLVWLYLNRKEPASDRVWTGVVAAVTTVLILVPPVVNWRAAGSAEALNAAGGVSPVNRHLLVVAVFLFALNVANRAAWRDPVRRMASLWMVAAGAAVALMYLYQTAVVGDTSYYYEKLLHELIVVTLVCLGATTYLVPAWGRPGHSTLATRPRGAIVLALAVVVALMYNANPDREVWRKPAGDKSWGVAWFERDLEQLKLAKSVSAAMSAKPADDKVNFFQLKGNWQANYFGTLWVDVLSRNLGTAWPIKPPFGSHNQQTPQELTELILAAEGTPIRVLTNDPQTLGAVQSLRTGRPDLGLDVLFSNPSLCVFDFKRPPVLRPGEQPAPVPTIPYPKNGCAKPTKTVAP